MIIDDYEEVSPRQPTNENDKAIITKVDFKKFDKNNWIKPSSLSNRSLQAINKRGGALWINPSGEIFFRRSQDEEPSKLANDKAKMVISNFLDSSSILLFKGSGTGENAVPPDIASNDVYMVMDRFTPFAMNEFYSHNGVVNRTSFTPSKYLKMDSGPFEEPETIIRLIKHICNYDEVHYQWVVNWLAGFLQTLKTSQVALVLRGVEGAGKGLFMDEVITHLFGKDFTVTVDDDRLNSNFKDWIGEKLFYNLNEISHDGKSRRAVINFIKVLITDRLIQMEAKNKDAKPTEIFGNILITSNEVSPLEISVTDRRFTVFQTGGNIKKLGWDTDATVRAIKKELPYFAVMLKSLQVDWKLYNEALDTTAKRNIVMSTNDRYSLFLTALKNNDIDYFHLQTEDISIITDLEDIFSRGHISTKEIEYLFNTTSNDDEHNISSRAIMKKMRGLDALMFEMRGGKPVHGKIIMGTHYFSLN